MAGGGVRTAFDTAVTPIQWLKEAELLEMCDLAEGVKVE